MPVTMRSISSGERASLTEAATASRRAHADFFGDAADGDFFSAVLVHNAAGGGSGFFANDGFFVFGEWLAWHDRGPPKGILLSLP